jgi:Fur family ferric uptake transcriptional regulator
MHDYETRFAAFLESKHLRLTKARELILNTVFGLHEHFDAEQLYDLIHQVSKDVSRATVYRTIPLLAEAGLIQKSVRSESRDKFEHIFGHPRHAHWVCKNCGAVIETGMQEVLDLLQLKAQSQNFRIGEVSVEVKGLCFKCQTDENESQ